MKNLFVCENLRRFVKLVLRICEHILQILILTFPRQTKRYENAYISSVNKHFDVLP